jgi:putative spermidine/putrescine transport system substrate-binding protein
MANAAVRATNGSIRMQNVTRRNALLGTGGALLITAVSKLRAANAQEALLRVTHFGGPYQILDELVGKPFAELKLGKVEYDVEVSPSVIAKLQTQRGNPPFDIGMVSRPFGLRALNAGLLEKVSAADFPEINSLIPDALPAAGWGIAMILDTYDMMIDTKQVKEPVTSWLDLWKPEYKGKTALPAAANGGATIAFIFCILKAVAGNDRSDAAVNETFVRLKALKPSVRVFYPDSIQATQLIDRGDISIAPQFGVRIANQSRVSPHIVKATPKEGVVAIPYDLCIAKGSGNVELARKYINLTLTKGVQQKLVEKLLATPSRLGLDIPSEIAQLVTLDASKIWFPDEEYSASKQREWLDRYTREVQA